MREVAPGIYRWTAQHPEWHPGAWGAEVASFAVREPGRTLLIDPLVGEEQWDALGGVVDGAVQTLITIPYHVRSAAACAARYGGSIWGHRGCANRLARSDPFQELSPGSAPPGVRPTVLGKPRR